MKKGLTTKFFKMVEQVLQTHLNNTNMFYGIEYICTYNRMNNSNSTYWKQRTHSSWVVSQ